MIRKSGKLYFYLNGVSIGNIGNTASLSNLITFHFGATQQTYKYLDEFRFVNKALYNAPANYECSSVPFDTNLSLVLPDSVVPVADEYWKITSNKTNLLDGDFTQGFLPASFHTQATASAAIAPDMAPSMGIHSKYSSVVANPDHLTLSRTSSNVTLYLPSTTYFWVGGLASRIVKWNSTNNGAGVQSGLANGTYTFSVVLGDGSIASMTFNSVCAKQTTKYETKDFAWGQLGFVQYREKPDSTGTSAYYGYVYILPKVNTSMDIRYVQLVKGSSTDLKAEYISSVTLMDKDDLNTPTLAVRTDIEITDYQIGGPRPSLPAKGLVWALVESQFIKSLQVYNGQAWEGCDGRIWTGERWIPYSSYNVITLKDMYDVVDASGNNYEYIYTEQGFWSWWQKSWNAFTEKFFALNFSGSGGSGSAATKSFWDKIKDAVTDGLATLIEGLFAIVTEVLKKLIGAATDLLTGIFGFLTTTVLGGVSDFFGSLGGLSSPFQTPVTDAEGNTTVTTGLPEGIPAVFSFFSGLFMVMPEELRTVLFFGFGLMLLLAVFKIVKE